MSVEMLKPMKTAASAVALSIALSSALVAVAMPPASAASQCSIDVQGPHITDTGPAPKRPGIIAKVLINCDPGGDLKWGGNLWLCPTEPDVRKEWIENHCTVKKQNSAEAAVFHHFPAGSTRRYIPPESEYGARGSGWWIAEAFWVDSDNRLQHRYGIARPLSLN